MEWEVGTVDELVKQPGLAETGIAHDLDESSRTGQHVGHHLGVRRGLAPASDQGQVVPAETGTDTPW